MLKIYIIRKGWNIQSMNHTHTFVRYQRKNQNPLGKVVYRCNDPNCYYKVDRDFLIGKMSRCTSCGSEFILTCVQLDRKNPKCDNCANTAQARRKRQIKDVIEGIIPTTPSREIVLEEIFEKEN